MKRILTIALLFIGLLGYSQQILKESIDSGGGTASATGIKIVHTIGEVVVAEKDNGTLHVSEGFISSNFLTYLDIANYTPLTGVRAYPNPTTDRLNLTFSKTDNFQIQVYDMSGKVILQKESELTNEYSLDLMGLQSATYVILIKNSSTKQFKTFRILKE